MPETDTVSGPNFLKKFGTLRQRQACSDNGGMNLHAMNQRTIVEVELRVVQGGRILPIPDEPKGPRYMRKEAGEVLGRGHGCGRVIRNPGDR